MSQDQPNIREILITVSELLDAVAARSSGGERYNALCGSFLLGVVERELELSGEQDARQLKALATLLDSSAGDFDAGLELPALYQQFCRRVRAGDLDGHWDEVFEFAMTQVVDKVKVTNPDYLAPLHRGQGCG